MSNPAKISLAQLAELTELERQIADPHRLTLKATQDNTLRLTSPSCQVTVQHGDRPGRLLLTAPAKVRILRSELTALPVTKPPTRGGLLVLGRGGDHRHVRLYFPEGLAVVTLREGKARSARLSITAPRWLQIDRIARLATGPAIPAERPRRTQPAVA